MATLITPRRMLVLLFSLALGALVLHQTAVTDAFSNGQPASLVLGTSTFTTSGWGTSQTTFNQPRSMVVDPATGKVYVADGMNRRILRFASRSALANGAPAEAVLGQPNFTSSTAATTASGLRYPWGVAIDNQGRLWVADGDNNRVLRFDNAATKANGAPADGVLGQPNFTSSTAAVSQIGMSRPLGVSVDPAGRLFVVEPWSNRVLWFNTAATKANGAAADGVLGQPNFTSSGSALTQQGFSLPSGLTTDPSGWLWVADYGNHRVLLFDSQEPDAKPICACGSM